MSRINTNLGALTAVHAFQRNQASLSQTLTRLSTGLKINSGADDPSGLIASEHLRSDITGITQAIDNSQRAGNVLDTAGGALAEVSALLAAGPGPDQPGRQHRRPLPRRDQGQPAPARLDPQQHQPHQQQHVVQRLQAAQRRARLRHQRAVRRRPVSPGSTRPSSPTTGRPPSTCRWSAAPGWRRSGSTPRASAGFPPPSRWPATSGRSRCRSPPAPTTAPSPPRSTSTSR